MSVTSKMWPGITDSLYSFQFRRKGLVISARDHGTLLRLSCTNIVDPVTSVSPSPYAIKVRHERREGKRKGINKV